MSKFNNKPTELTINREGHAAYAMTDKSKLVTEVLTSFFNERKFYGDNSAEMEKTIRRVIAEDPDFVSRLAVFARREFNMRSVSHVLAAYLANEPKGKLYARRTVNGIVLRGDDVTELLAFYLSTFGKPLPNALRKGINDAFSRFDEYTLAKYKGAGRRVKMKDVPLLCHPAPKDEDQADLWKRLIEDRLAPPVTWETQLSAKGNNRGTWEELIDSGKVGYMALLRNLRNILEAQPRNLNKVLETLIDENAVRHSKQLPFRYLSAYREVMDMAGSRVLNALETAVRLSVDNLPKLPGTTVIAVDASGSMSATLSRNSAVHCSDVGMLLGLIANRICEDSLFYTFDTEIRQYPHTRHTPLLETSVHSPYGGGTDIALPFLHMIRERLLPDRIILLSDNECNRPRWGGMPVQAMADKYREKMQNDLWVHAIDLQGYGTQQFAGRHTNIIAGWSEKIFDFILLAERGEGALESTIAGYTWE